MLYGIQWPNYPCKNYWWGRPLLHEILCQTDRVDAKSPIFDLFSPIAPKPLKVIQRHRVWYQSKVHVRNIAPIYVRIAEISASEMKSGSKNTTVTSDFDGQEVKIWPFREWAMHPARLIIGNSRSLWTTLWGRYHVPQNAFLVVQIFDTLLFKPPPPLAGTLKYNVRCLSWVHWKAHSGLPITVN